jgi:PAS domain S-box-containing protein
MDKKVITSSVVNRSEQLENIQNLEQLDLDALSREELYGLIQELRVRQAELVKQSQAEQETLNEQFQQEIKARERVEEALQQSNIFKQVVLDSLPAHIAVLDREGNIIAANRAWFQFARENSDTTLIQAGLGDNYLEVCRRGAEAGSRSARKALAIISTVLANQQTHLSMEYPCHSAREKRWFLIHVTPLAGRDGGAVIAHENISVRKRAEEAVRESRERYRVIFTQAAVGMAIISTAGRWLQVNQKLCEIMGYTNQELLGLTLQAITHSDDQDTDFEDIRRMLAGELQTSIMEKRFMRKDGSIAWVNLTISLVQDPNGEPKYFIAVIEDITRRKQVEASLLWRNRELALLSQSTQAFNASLDQEETLTTILEAIRYLLEITACRVWLVDKETGGLVCQQVNEQGSRVILDRHLTTGKGLAGWVAQHNESVIVPDIRIDERPFQEIDPQIDKDIHAVLSIPLRVKQKVIGVLQALDTIPDRFTHADLELLEPLALTAAMALENARLYEQAQQDAETKATLLKEVNHRVKNNLAAIVGLLYTKRRRFGLLKDSTIYQALTEDIISQVQGLATVHSLLSASEWTPLHLSELTSQIIRSSLRILPHGKRISVDIPYSPARVTPQQANNLALIINELTTNTIKYASPEPPASLKITVNISFDEDQIRFEFRDNGPGYPKAILQLDSDAYSVGFEVIQNIVRKNLRGKLSLYNDHGAVTVIQFEAKV